MFFSSALLLDLSACCGELAGDHRELHVLTHSFPTRRSSDLNDSVIPNRWARAPGAGRRSSGSTAGRLAALSVERSAAAKPGWAASRAAWSGQPRKSVDLKSTRLNSSH